MMDRKVPLYCTICSKQLSFVEYDNDFEVSLICENEHKWWYKISGLAMGNFEFQCGQGEPEKEAFEAYEVIKEKMMLLREAA